MPTKQWWESRTVWANALLTVIAFLSAIHTIVPQEWLPYIVALTAILNILLRLITNQPIQGMGKQT